MPATVAEFEDVRHTLLLTTIHNLHDTPNFLATPVSAAARKTTETLRIVIFSPLFNLPVRPNSAADDASAAPILESQPARADAPGISRTAHFDDVQRLLTFVYVQATKVAQDVGRILLDIDVLLKGTGAVDPFPLPAHIVREAERIYSVTPRDTPFPALPASLEQRRAEIVVLEPDNHPLHAPPPPPPPADPSLPPWYPVVALGGTFDHLHAGHKILLSMGAWIASEKLIVGITDDSLLGKKEWKEVLEPLPARTARTHAFLELFRPGIFHDVTPISDVYGPTGWDPNVQGLVVSKETLSGAASIAKRREELSFSPLRTFVIDVISATESSVDSEDAKVLKTAKMSSTYIREWIMKNGKHDETS